jgi:FMN phosphatase YigB (HAD superfamily)
MNGCMVRAASSAFARLAEESGAAPDTVETIFWQYNDAVCRGDKNIDELNTALAERLGIMVDWYQYYLDAQEKMPGMDELVGWVAENYRVGILTNTMPGLVQTMLGRGLLPSVSYEVIIDSSEVKAIKPEEAIYQIAMERAGVAPHEILFIDDDRPNLVAASKLGWHTMKFQSHQPEEAIVAISTALQPV